MIGIIKFRKANCCIVEREVNKNDLFIIKYTGIAPNISAWLIKKIIPWNKLKLKPLKFALAAVCVNVTKPLLIFHIIWGRINSIIPKILTKNFLFKNSILISFKRITEINILINKYKVAYLDKIPKAKTNVKRK